KFFFSSRRRHTRCLSDWSSDVCSSDLDGPWPPTDMQRQLLAILIFHVGLNRAVPVRSLMITLRNAAALLPGRKHNPTEREIKDRSEERRVGKECRTQRWKYHELIIRDI